VLHDFGGPIATITGAAAAVFVTWRIGIGQLGIAKQQSTVAQQQAQLAAVRLQHDLFDRRFALFEAARTFLVKEIYPEMNPNTEGIFIFGQQTAPAVFLVDAPLKAYLETLYKSAFELQRLSTLVTLQQGGPNHADNVQQRYQLVEWFGALLDVLVAKFQPFLKLDYVNVIQPTSPHGDGYAARERRPSSTRHRWLLRRIQSPRAMPRSRES
jgi:hypothetical protein